MFFYVRLAGVKTECQMRRLKAAADKKGFLCVGLDSDPSYLPGEVLRQYESPADAVLAFNSAVIESTSGYAACYKVQIAYYEAMGVAGLACYSKTLKELRSKGLQAIADVKRGDIADTAAAYARAHFSGDFEADFVTLNPYMGFDTLEPFAEWAEKEGKGAFVLLRTSNAGAADIERLPLARSALPAGEAKDERAGLCALDAVGQGIRRMMSRYMEDYRNKGLCPPFGFVAGCTDAASARETRSRYPEFFFLIPGYGAQGGAAATAAELLAEAGGVVNSSRGVLCAWKKDESLKEKAESGALALEEIAGAAGRAAKAASEELLAAVEARSAKTASGEPRLGL